MTVAALRLANFAEVDITTSVTSSTPGTEQSISVSSGQETELPTGPGWKGVLWDKQEGIASEDANREVIAIVARTGTTLTVIRGCEGTSASDHSTAGQLVLSLVPTALDIEVRNRRITPQDFGYDEGNASADVTTAFQRMVDYSFDHRVELHFPPGDYYINNDGAKVVLPTKTWPWDSNIIGLKISGAGLDLSRIYCGIPDGAANPAIDFDRDVLTGVSSFALSMHGLSFFNNSTRGEGSMIRFDKVTNKVRLTECEFYSNNKQVRNLLELTDCFEVNLNSCYFTGGHTCIKAQNDNINGGEIKDFGSNFSGIRNGFYIGGTQTFQRLGLFGTKFTGPKPNAGWVKIGSGGQGSIATFTSGATSLNVGTGWSWPGTGQQIPVFLFNDTAEELVFADSYSSPNLTLNGTGGLTRDWSSDGSLYMVVGCLAVACKRFTNAIHMANCQFEGAHIALAGFGSLGMYENTQSTFDYTPYPGIDAQLGGVFLGGSPAKSARIFGTVYSMNPTETNFPEYVWTLGGGEEVLTQGNVQINAGSYSTKDDVLDADGSPTTRQINISGAAI